jgi:hypothetical protein
VTDRINFRALLTLGFGILGLMILSTVATAQVPASVVLDWTLPTQNVGGTPIPATGPDSLAKVEGWISTSTIPNAPTTAPTFTLTPVGVTTTQTITVTAGATGRARLRVCNVAGFCSSLSNEVTFPVAGVPGSITNVTIRITITPP